MSELFITSDQHFGHWNICQLAGRPFSSVEEMNSELIRLWNETVKPDDRVIHLGDFTLGGKKQFNSFRSQLNGEITWILGNHDAGASPGWIEFAITDHWKKRIGLIHDPYYIKHYDPYQVCDFYIHGHTHNREVSMHEMEKPMYCACVEKTKYKPVRIEEFIGRYKQFLKGGAH